MKCLISGSAIGFYGNRGDEELCEDSDPGNGFLAELTQEWEAEAKLPDEHQVRVVLLRTGVVLGLNGGALQKMLLPFKMGLGGKLGTGLQWMSWIHIADLCGIIDYLLNHELRGPVNAVAPQPTRNVDFTRTLASVLHRPAFLPAPAIGLRLLLGEMADELLLSSQRVLPQVLTEAGFQWDSPELKEALQNLFPAN